MPACHNRLSSKLARQWRVCSIQNERLVFIVGLKSAGLNPACLPCNSYSSSAKGRRYPPAACNHPLRYFQRFCPAVQEATGLRRGSQELYGIRNRTNTGESKELRH
jgi:hypothetical protein